MKYFIIYLHYGPFLVRNMTCNFATVQVDAI